MSTFDKKPGAEAANDPFAPAVKGVDLSHLSTPAPAPVVKGIDLSHLSTPAPDGKPRPAPTPPPSKPFAKPDVYRTSERAIWHDDIPTTAPPPGMKRVLRQRPPVAEGAGIFFGSREVSWVDVPLDDTGPDASNGKKPPGMDGPAAAPQKKPPADLGYAAPWTDGGNLF
jgi:hypothetical protein